MSSAVSEKALNMPLVLKDAVRASILRQMVLVLLAKEVE